MDDKIGILQAAALVARCTKIINRYIRHLKRELTSKQQFIRQLHQT